MQKGYYRVALRAPGVVYIESVYFTAVCIYTTKSSTPAISLFFLGPNPVVVYIFGVPNINNLETLEHKINIVLVGDRHYQLIVGTPSKLVLHQELPRINCWYTK